MPGGYKHSYNMYRVKISPEALGLDDLEVRAFTLRDTAAHRYAPWAQMLQVCQRLEIPRVRALGTYDQLLAHASHVNGHGLPVFTDDELRKLAEIKYPNGKHGEGIVIRSLDSSWSFKVLNLLYKD